MHGGSSSNNLASSIDYTPELRIQSREFAYQYCHLGYIIASNALIKWCMLRGAAEEIGS